MKEIKLARPNGLHEHLREGYLLKFIIDFFNVYGWVVAMGNLEKSVSADLDILRYSEEIHGNHIAPPALASAIRI